MLFLNHDDFRYYPVVGRSFSTSIIVNAILRENEWEWIECYNVCSDWSIYFVIILSIMLTWFVSVLLMNPVSIFFWIILTWVIILCLVRIFINSFLYWLMTRGLVEVIIITTGFWGLVNESLMKTTILISRFILLCFEKLI